MIKSQLRTQVANAADALNSPRWDFTAGGEVDFWIGATMDQEWKRILDASAFYRVGRRTVTADADGYYAVADLSTGTGDNQQRLYKVIGFTQGDIVYEQTSMEQYLLSPQDGLSNYPQWLWFFEGDQIMSLPKTPAGTALIVVNHIPTRFDQLADDASTVTWPDGYEQVLVWSAAAKLLQKGGVETGAAASLEMMANMAREDMLQDLLRRSLKPVAMKYNDSAIEWGG